MKRTIIGVGLLLSAVIADAGVVISAAILSLSITEWSAEAGRFWTALTGNGLLFPFILAKGLFVVALIILAIQFFKKVEKSE